MSDFFDRVQSEAAQLETIEQQRAFYEQLAISTPARYAEGFDVAATMTRPDTKRKLGAMPIFLSFEDGSMQGFYDYLQTPVVTCIDTAQAYLQSTYSLDTRVVRSEADMSDYDRIVFAGSRQVPALPAICLYMSTPHTSSVAFAAAAA